ncbi:MAG TPA: guanine deaminase, partial [Elusimicrobiota bacterium]|nr:guanine deaminase [Elusimicrobiota bacterium]
PGLVDAHCHLPQYPAVASDGLELLPWLKTHIFPLEKGFRGEAARPLAKRFFADLAAHGTTTAAVYASIWKDSTEVCFEEALASGLRVILGKVMMDRHSYDSTFHGTPLRRMALSLRESEELCRKWHGQGGGRILYAFTPRFALSCSGVLMKAAGELAKRFGAYVQTHLAENHAEVAAVRGAYPRLRSYTDVYATCGLIGPRTILAHAIWLDPAQRRLIAELKGAVAHCPTSNAFLASGIMDLGGLQRAGVPVALGSDVAAGPSLCLFEVMRQAIYGQRLARAHRLFAHSSELGPAEAFHMATLGGARALRLGDRAGSLEPGKDADFVVLDPEAYEAPGRREGAEAPQAVAARLVFRAGRFAVRSTFARGQKVFGEEK